MRQPPGTLALESMPGALVELFRRSFLSTDRPRPREWIEPLDTLAKALKKCDLHSGHYYYCELRECPWCGIESQARVRLFNFLLSGDDSRRGHFRLDEIWKEIESVKAPGAPLIRWDKILKAPAPSADVEGFVKVRDSRFTLALIFSAIAGPAIHFFTIFPFPFILLILAGMIARAIARIDHHLVEKIQARQRWAKEVAEHFQEEYDREAGGKRWDAKLNELRNQKEAYENLAQTRRFRLQQLEAEARKDQLDEFLDQFKLNEAEFKGIGPTIKTVLLSHGIETAADVKEIEEMTQIPSIGRWRADRLLEWRRGQEQKFVFDPARGVPPRARIMAEREVDALRVRLEGELNSGAHYLRSMKQQIETSRKKLRPALTEAGKELAQAEKDLEVASRRNSLAPILIVLIVAFFIGWAIRL